MRVADVAHDTHPVKWAKIIDERKCIGCHACTVACKEEHSVPLGVTRTFVKQVETGRFPSVRRHFQVTRCNQCDDPPCVAACPTSAMYRRRDGIVDFNRDTCIGCKACIAACPYDAIYIDPDTHSAEKCNFCTHRIDVGLQPACVVVCPTQAIIVGDMNDPGSDVSHLIATQKSFVRRPEKRTFPKLFYVEGNEAALNPLAASAQGGYAWAERQHPSYPSQQDSGVIMGGPGQKKSQSGYPAQSAAAAILAYQSESKPPWDWRISTYTWTKSLSAGTFLMAAVCALFGGLSQGAGWDVGVAVVSAVSLALTGAFLVGDLSHPERFYLILLRPQWRSWLARGAFLIAGFAAVVGLFFLLRLLEVEGGTTPLLWAGLLLAAGVAVYTAFLLGQSKGRDLWQNPLLPAHFLVQAGLAGSAALLLLGTAFSLSPDEVLWLRWSLGITLGAHLFLGLSELAMPHATDVASRCARHMVQGRWAPFCWGLGMGLVALILAVVVSTLAPWLVIAAAMAVVGLFLYEHAYIQAGQSVPLS